MHKKLIKKKNVQDHHALYMYIEIRMLRKYVTLHHSPFIVYYEQAVNAMLESSSDKIRIKLELSQKF